MSTTSIILMSNNSKRCFLKQVLQYNFQEPNYNLILIISIVYFEINF